MRLKSLRLRNFRCYKDEVRLDFDDITAIIGKNDAGKSSIMDALNIFIEEAKLDKDDATKNGDPRDVAIICEFDELPDTAIIDEKNPTTLADEYLLNAKSCLEIHKVYDGSLATPKLTRTCALARHPTTEKVADLLELKRAELIARAKELSVDLSKVNKSANAPIRKAIWAGVPDLKLQPRLVPLDKEDAKAAWEKIKTYMPAFALFKSDRPSTDQDPEAQDPLKTAVKEALKEKEAELSKIATFVEQEVKKIADQTVAKLKQMDPSLANELKPEFSTLKWDSLFKASITGDGNIPINKRGSGVKRLILLNFFRARAEQLAKAKNSAHVIYAIEEPETSQHPNNQRMLLSALPSLASTPGCQVIVTTHTPMLARSLPDTKLRYVDMPTSDTRAILVGGKAQNEKFAKALGVLPDNGVKLFIGVEGKHDINFLKCMSRVLLGAGLDALDLEAMEINGEIIFFPLGGDNLALWTSRLHNLSRPEFHLYDRDVPPPAAAKHQQELDKINARPKCKALCTGKREMENYLHIEAIKKAYETAGIALSLTANFAAFDDVPTEVAKLVHAAATGAKPWDQLSDDQRRKKVSRAKHILNSDAPAHMTKAYLDEIDPAGDVVGWFKEMRQLVVA